MATLVSYQSGNLTGATTFKTVETGTRALVDTLSVANNTNTTTSTVFNGNAQDFTIANLSVIEGIMLYCKQTTTTGTVKVVLSDDSGTTETRTVTVNATDLPTQPSWVFFKFGSTITGDGGTDYAIGIQGSSAGNATFYRASATAADWNHVVRTNTTATAAAGDRLYIVGDWTAAATGSTYTVTMDSTATTDYGAIDICDSGILDYGTTSATNYILKTSGVMNIWGDGTLQIGTTGTPIPRDSTAALNFDSSSNVEWGMVVNAGGTFISQGLSRTAAKLIDRCYLNTDEAANSTSLGVDTDTGWLDNDIIAVASTTRTNTQCESGTLNGAAGASTLTVDGFAGTGGGVLNAHSGTSPTQAEVILLTRNVSIYGASASLQAYIDIKAGAIVDCDWTQFYWMGSNTSLKRGIDIAVTTTSVTFDYCSLHTFSVSGSRGFNVAGTSGTGVAITNCVTYNIANEHFVNVASTGSQTVSGLWCMLNTTASTVLISLADAGINFSDILAVGTTGVGISQTEAGKLGTWTNIRSHSCNSYNIEFTNGFGFIDGMTSYRGNGNGGLAINGGTNGAIDLEIEDLLEFGSNTQNVRLTVGTLQLNNPILAGDTTFSTANGISNQGNSSNAGLRIYNGQLGVVTGIYTAHTTSDLAIGAQGRYRVYLNHTILASSTEVNTPSSLSVGTYIASDNHDQVAGAHKTWSRYGIIEKETTIVRSGTSSLKMTPNNANFKLTSDGWKGGWAIQVASGQTCTFNVYVAQGQTYNGGRVRLIQKRNDAIGISTETLIDTATSASDYSGGHQWELLTGTTSAVTADGTVEFYIDCDGTAGSVYADDWTASVA